MPVNFDLPILRDNTHSVKYDGREAYFGTRELQPLWVADMDFAVPECISQALQQRLAHPIYGYSIYPESVYEALIGWFARRHRWSIAREQLFMAPGVVPSLYAAVQAFAKVGEGVIVQPPVYFPFFSAVTSSGRQLLLNPLIESEGDYRINFAELEQQARSGARLLLLCSPHNPVGRVWRQDELQQLLAIARRYQLVIFSDDIHCDLTYAGQQHTMLARLAQPGDRVVTAIAPNKTFNIPGLGLSALVAAKPEREALQQQFARLDIHIRNPFSLAAFEAAYRDGDAWLDALMAYLQQTCDAVAAYLARELPCIRLRLPEATFLLWLDCRAMGLSDAELQRFFIEECQLGLSPGRVFGAAGSGFMRLNIGAPRAQIMAALAAIKRAWLARD